MKNEPHQKDDVKKDLVSLSKFLSLVLRHEPGSIGITLDSGGWVSCCELIDACARHGKPLSIDQLLLIVETSDKLRFALSEDKTRIRANQGHSVGVDLGYDAKTPPVTLYHGTASRFVDSIALQSRCT